MAFSSTELTLSVERFSSEFDNMLDYVRQGDVILTCNLDRITRSIGGLAKLLETLKEDQVGFRVLDNPALKFQKYRSYKTVLNTLNLSSCETFRFIVPT